MNHLVTAGKESSLCTRVPVAPLPHYPKLAVQFSSLCGWSSRIRGPNKTCTLWAEGVHSLVKGGLLPYLGKYTLLKKSHFFFCLTNSIYVICSVLCLWPPRAWTPNPSATDILRAHYSQPILFFLLLPLHPSLSVFLLADPLIGTHLPHLLSQHTWSKWLSFCQTNCKVKVTENSHNTQLDYDVEKPIFQIHKLDGWSATNLPLGVYFHPNQPQGTAYLWCYLS